MIDLEKQLLVIDDDLLVSETLSRLLSKAGYQVTCARSADEALECVKYTDFKMIVSDIRMPGKNGVEAVESIQKFYSQRKKKCGYMFLTGYAEEDTPGHAIRLGVTQFVLKPFDAKDFLARIEDELKIVQEEDALLREIETRQPKRITPSSKKRKTVDVHRVVVTGIGVVSPNGIGKETFWGNLKKGLSFGVAPPKTT